MSLDHFLWSSTGSTLRPMILALRLSNSGFIFAMYPSSVVHTGVKSLGWEKRTAQESPSQSWKRRRPSVVSASKSGATSPICRDIAKPSLHYDSMHESKARSSGGREIGSSGHRAIGPSDHQIIR